MNNNNSESDLYGVLEENANEGENSQNGNSILNYTQNNSNSLYNTEQSKIVGEEEENNNNNTNSKVISNLINIIKVKTFICNKCKKIPILTFLNNDFSKLKYSCDCNTNKEITYVKLLEDFFLVHNTNKTDISQLNPNNSYNINDNLDNLDNLCYCHNCNEFFLINNNNLHNTHEISELNDYKNFIQNEFELNEEENNNYIIKKVNFYDNFTKLINLLFTNFIIYLKPKFIENIKNFRNFIQSIKIEINSHIEFEDKTKEYGLISKIKIENTNFNNLKELSQLDLFALQELLLESNNIKSIEPLKNKDFRNLRILNLKMNRLGDDSIKNLGNIMAPKLEELILENNCFNSYELFNSIKKFKKLKILDISSNRFYKKCEQIYSNNIIYEFKLMEIGNFSNGVFSDETIKLMEKLDLSNMRILKLNGNNLTNLKFLLKYNIKCPILEEIYLNNNDLEQIDELEKFAIIKKIEANNNYLNANGKIFKNQNIEIICNLIKKE